MKSQSSMEYLMTYGWAFLLFLIIIGAFMYLGVNDFGRNVQERCVGTDNIICSEFLLKENELIIVLINGAGAKINLTGEYVFEGEKILDNSDIYLESQIEIKSGDSYTLRIPLSEGLHTNGTVDFISILPKNEVVKLDIILKYKEWNKDFPKSSKIELLGKVQ